MRAYLINLDAATDRRAHMERAFAATGLPLVRVPAIDGRAIALPDPGYSERLYHRRHGRTTKPGEIGCYFSHLHAIDTFLTSGDEHGLICEDDLNLLPHFDATLAAALRTARHWNVLRLSGLSPGHPRPVADLGHDRQLCVNFGRLKGAGAYVLDRRGAERFAHGLLPMWLPWDHAVDREWPLGLRACSVFPFPVSQTDRLFRSSIQGGHARKLPKWRRWATTYPYQIVTELSRWAHRGTHYLRLKLAGIGSD